MTLKTNNSTEKKLTGPLQLKEVAALLSVSAATVRNWIKSGKIKVIRQGRTSFFDRQEILQIKQEIESGASYRLKSRRNKIAVEGTYIPTEYVNSAEYIKLAEKILEIANGSSCEINPNLILIEIILALFLSQGRLTCPPEFQDHSLMELAIQDKLLLGEYSSILNSLFDVNQKISANQSEILRQIRQLNIRFIPGDDLLGLVYMSLSNLSKRKSNGSYYTPSKIVDALVEQSLDSLCDISFPKIVDPCCGSGNFLIKLFLAAKLRLLKRGLSTEEAEKHLLQDCLSAYDIDETAVTLAKINLELLRECPSGNLFSFKIECRNTLANYCHLFAQAELETFDLVIGNPPWGYSFSQKEFDLYKNRFITAQASLESFCLFIEYGLGILKPNGILSYVLPEAMLNVQLHAPIRQILLEKTQILKIHLLGQQFSKVFTPAFTLIVKNSQVTLNHEILVEWNNWVQSIPQQRFYENEMYIFNVKTSHLEDKIIKHMKSLPGIRYLKGHAEFALGIVTGNNKEWVLPRPFPGSEHILKGNDVFKYNFYPSENYIAFEPQKFQQVAPEKLYRAPEKLLYRFINENLVFAYDDRQTLSLNSANLVIPKLPGYSIKYILAVLNSRAAQFSHTVSFSSIKVLRKHIESIPIPPCDLEKQQSIIKNVDLLLSEKNETLRAHLYEQIDTQIMKLYGFNAEQQGLILEKFADIKFL
ncbi:TaqI-like C-terminal specificity domain-containing protein [Desulfitobacterium sp. AusDCA]|uniref:TaqI-like C-terminal specificity domain-containing protein n=1 Tax=Desulfitobacterium sp. AusDCA TaxID=3240383 RepID=UPI003DA6DE6E